MTIISPIEVECAVCGETSEHREIMSTSASGSPDLDTRPPQMERSTIYYWIQHCPTCHYCSTNISECDSRTRELVKSAEYQSVAQSSGIPINAAAFMAVSYINEQMGKLTEAAWRAIHAAWICDDRSFAESAKSCRIQAIELIERASKNDRVLSCDTGTNDITMIDLLRRTGQFEKALESVEKAKTENSEDIILRILRFQETLIEQRDMQAHTVDEAVETIAL